MKKQIYGAVIAACSLLALPLTVFAQPTTAAPPLEALAQQARDNMIVVTPEMVAGVKARTMAAVNDLHEYLRRSGPKNAAAWEAYLRWPELMAQLQAEVPDPKVVESVLDKWEDNYPGLEAQRFVRTREAVRDYVYLAADVANENYAEEYARRVDELAGLVERYEESGSSDDAVAIGRTLGWLERTGQAQQLVETVRARYQRPNFFGYGSARFAAIGFEQPVNRVTPVNDIILGTHVRGTAHMTGGTTLRLVPDPNVARFQLLLAGTAVSNNVGHNRGVTICSTGVTALQACKNLWMDEAGLFSSVATANGRTNTTITGIDGGGGRIRQRIATNRVYDSKPQAEVIASQRAAGRLQRSFEAEASPMVADANRRFMERFKTPLTRRNAYPEDVSFSTTPYYVVVKSLSADKNQIGAPTPPARLSLPFDVCTQMHESAVTNFGESLLAGMHLTDERLVQILRDELKTEVPDELQITEDKDPWSITFARESPARARFEDGRVFMAIRGDQFTRADQVVNEPIEITANYNIEITNEGTARLVRDGDVEVNFLERERLSAAQVTFRTFLRRKFRAMFKEEFVGEGLKPKGRWAKAGTLRLELIDSNNHWLNLGWNLPIGGQRPRLAEGEKTEATVPVSAPAKEEVSSVEAKPAYGDLAQQVAQFLGMKAPLQ